MVVGLLVYQGRHWTWYRVSTIHAQPLSECRGMGQVRESDVMELLIVVWIFVTLKSQSKAADPGLIKTNIC